MIFLKKTEIFICQNKYQYFKFDFSAPPPPPADFQYKKWYLGQSQSQQPSYQLHGQTGLHPRNTAACSAKWMEAEGLGEREER